MILKKSAHPCECRDKDIISEIVITVVLTPACAGESGELRV